MFFRDSSNPILYYGRCILVQGYIFIVKIQNQKFMKCKQKAKQQKISNCKLLSNDKSYASIGKSKTFRLSMILFTKL
jgi:hypothetical protein